MNTDLKSQIVERMPELVDRLLADRKFRPCGGDGDELLGCSPLREEDTPSFQINRRTGYWRDFNPQVGAKGDIFHLVGQMHSIDSSSRDGFPQILNRCAELLGIDVSAMGLNARSGQHNGPRMPTDAEMQKIFAFYGLRWNKLVATQEAPNGLTVSSVFFPDIEQALAAVIYESVSVDGKRVIKAKSVARFDKDQKEVPWPNGKRRSVHVYKDPVTKEALEKGTGAGIFPRWIVEQSILGGDVKQWCVVTGGEEKALAAIAAGFLAITPTRGERIDQRTADWLAASGVTRIILAFDNDEAGRVGAEASAIALFSTSKNMRVRSVLWPSKCGEKWDLCDVLRDYGIPGIRRLINLAPTVRLSCPGTRPVIANTYPCETWNISKGGDDTCEHTDIHRQAGEILQQYSTVTDGWPRQMAGSVLFYVDKPEAATDLDMPQQSWVKTMEDENDLVAYSSRKADLYWKPGQSSTFFDGQRVSLVTKGEFLSYYRQNPPVAYRAVELIPHQPIFADTYYVPWDVQSAAKKCDVGWVKGGPNDQGILGVMNADTPVDRQLIMAAFLTTLWGGEPGYRPIFVFAADEQGSGKTTTAQAISMIVGGSISYSLDEREEDSRKRLLGDEAMLKRVLIIDNVKRKVESEALERLVTEATIDGHKMYHGYSTRPNRMTIFATLNRPVLGRDAAQRAVIIKLARPQSFDFHGIVMPMIRKNAARLIWEGLEILRRSPKTEGVYEGAYSRWKVWEKEVLSKLKPYPLNEKKMIDGVIVDKEIDLEAIMTVLKARRNLVDIETKMISELAETLKRIMTNNGLHWESGIFAISRKAMQKIIQRVDGAPMTTKQFMTRMEQICGIGDLGCLKESQANSHAGSGGLYKPFIWCGPGVLDRTRGTIDGVLSDDFMEPDKGEGK